MKVILLEDIKGVGKKDQIINANDGYAKNFLFPKNLAVEATKGNMTQLDRKKKNEEEKRQQELDDAKELAKQIAEKKVTLSVKTGDNGKLFGAVTNKEIGAALKEQAGIDIDKKKIVVKEAIKTIGEKEVDIKLHPKVTAKLKVNIVEA
ncbi:MAG: 50S ribosomal protein L9 [Firmicutes bacterium]|nr:50S ribosomal protein L9 [Bacillota bacterium]